MIVVDIARVIVGGVLCTICRHDWRWTVEGDPDDARRLRFGSHCRRCHVRGRDVP